MKLIKYENYQIVPSDQALQVKPIRDIFNEDTSANKEFFYQQLSYLYFMKDPMSPYADIIDLDERAKQVIDQEELPEDFKPSERLQRAMEIYEVITTTTTKKLLESMRKAVNKIGKFLENVDLTKTDDKGRPVYSITSVTAATDKVPALAKKLIETEKIVSSEIEEVGRARGGNESKKMFEDGFDGLFT